MDKKPKYFFKGEYFYDEILNPKKAVVICTDNDKSLIEKEK